MRCCSSLVTGRGHSLLLLSSLCHPFQGVPEGPPAQVSAFSHFSSCFFLSQALRKIQLLPFISEKTKVQKGPELVGIGVAQVSGSAVRGTRTLPARGVLQGTEAATSVVRKLQCSGRSEGSVSAPTSGGTRDAHSAVGAGGLGVS